MNSESLRPRVAVDAGTERDIGQTRAFQPKELLASHHYATSVYRSEFAVRLQGQDMSWSAASTDSRRSRGYTKEFLEGSSPRREQIKDHLREVGIDGAGAAQVAAHRTRDREQLLSPEQELERHRELAAQHGHQADRIVAQAREHSRTETHIRGSSREPCSAIRLAFSLVRIPAGQNFLDSIYRMFRDQGQDDTKIEI